MLKSATIFPLLKYALGCTLLVLFLNANPTKAQTPISKEYQVKSVFLFNFTHFVNWPADSFDSLQSPFIIGIVGDDPFGNYIDETVAGEKVMDHPVIVQRYKSMAEIGDCHILFINYKDTSKVRETLDILKNHRTLTVSEVKNFTSMGGMIAFHTSNEKVMLEINSAAAKDAQLTISSKLLRLAEEEN